MLKLSVKQIKDELTYIISKEAVMDELVVGLIRDFSEVYFKINQNIHNFIENRFSFGLHSTTDCLLSINNTLIITEEHANSSDIHFHEIHNSATLSLSLKVSHNNYLLKIKKDSFDLHDGRKYDGRKYEVGYRFKQILSNYILNHFMTLDVNLNYEIEKSLKKIIQLTFLINSFILSDRINFQDIFDKNKLYTLPEIENLTLPFADQLLLINDRNIIFYLNKLKEN